MSCNNEDVYKMKRVSKDFSSDFVIMQGPSFINKYIELRTLHCSNVINMIKKMLQEIYTDIKESISG